MSNLPITATFTFRGRVNSVSELPMDAAIYDVYAVENLTYALLPQGWVNTNEIYETTYTREEVIAMLTEIQLELDEMKITKVRSAGFAPYSKDPFRRGVNCSKEIIQQKIDALKGNTKHWIDNADSYICTICNYETRPNPVKYNYKCPKCGFVDSNDIEKINALKENEDGKI